MSDFYLCWASLSQSFHKTEQQGRDNTGLAIVHGDLVFRSQENAIHVHRTDDTQKEGIQTEEGFGQRTVQSVSYSGDVRCFVAVGSTLIAGLDTGIIEARSMRTGKVTTRYEGVQGSIFSRGDGYTIRHLQVSDGCVFASTSGDSVYRWEMSTGKQLTKHKSGCFNLISE